MRPDYLLFLDIDNTQFPTDKQVVQPHATLPYAYVLKDQVEQQCLPLVHCSGRSPAHVERSMHEIPVGQSAPVLARTDMIIANVGTEILRRRGDGYAPVDGYIDPVAGGYFDNYREAITKALNETPGLVLQSAAHLGRYKISVWGESGVQGAAVTPVLIRNLRDNGVDPEKVTLTLSQQSKLAIDVAPLGATKGAAVKHVAAMQGIPLHRVYVGGDSMNDLEMLSLPNVKVILPANAQEELVQALQGKREAGEVFHSKYAYAHGILDGLLNHRLISRIPEPGKQEVLGPVVSRDPLRGVMHTSGHPLSLT